MKKRVSRLSLLFVVLFAVIGQAAAQTLAPNLLDATPTKDSVQSTANADMKGNFFERFAHAYWEDWTEDQEDGPEPPRRDFPAPVSSPPFPFSD